MGTKTTLKHQTETGAIGTRKTEREYTHVVVYLYTEAEAQRDADSCERAAAHYEDERDYMLEHISEATEWGGGKVYVQRGHNLLTTDAEWYTKQAAKQRTRRDATLKMAGKVFVASWHGSAMNAANAADKLIARGFRGIAVEAINGGERGEA